MNTQNEPQCDQHDAPKQKQPYTPPALVKHGNVETLTQLQNGPSGPIPG